MIVVPIFLVGVFKIKKENSKLKSTMLALISFILLEEFSKVAIIAPLLINSRLSEANINIIYKLSELALVILLNYLLTKEKIYFKFKMSRKKVLFFILAILYIGLIVISGPKSEILISFSLTLLTVIAEEFLFRGVLLSNILRIFMGQKKYGRLTLFLSIVIASLLFSIEHLTNLANQPIIATTCQVIQAFGLGFLLCILYIRSGSLIFPACFHFLINFPVFYYSQSAVRTSASQTRNSSLSIISSMVIAFVYILIAISISHGFRIKNQLHRKLKRESLSVS